MTIATKSIVAAHFAEQARIQPDRMAFITIVYFEYSSNGRTKWTASADTFLTVEGATYATSQYETSPHYRKVRQAAMSINV